MPKTLKLCDSLTVPQRLFSALHVFHYISSPPRPEVKISVIIIIIIVIIECAF